MNDEYDLSIIPYSAIIGQAELKLALEIVYVASGVRGVLLSGERGTGKSSTVRAFSRMVHAGRLPVTIPINVTEDRVVGGWKVESLLGGKADWQAGLLEEAAARAGGLLYIDEVNLLDDHIVNILLDVTATGILEIQREGRPETKQIGLSLIGTMNPEEGGLRPQLLDRFALMANVRTETEQRREILQTVLRFDEARRNAKSAATWLAGVREQDSAYAVRLNRAKSNLPDLNDEVIELSVALADRLVIDGHRGEMVLALAAQACAALRGHDRITRDDLRDVAPLALQHRVRGASVSYGGQWGGDQDAAVSTVLRGAS